jgi:hypothetical protein
VILCRVPLLLVQSIPPVMHGRLAILTAILLLRVIGSRRKSLRNGDLKAHFSVSLKSTTHTPVSDLVGHCLKFLIALALHTRYVEFTTTFYSLICHSSLGMSPVTMPLTMAPCYRNSQGSTRLNTTKSFPGVSAK